jgi:hypothetical protein
MSDNSTSQLPARHGDVTTIERSIDDYFRLLQAAGSALIGNKSSDPIGQTDSLGAWQEQDTINPP